MNDENFQKFLSSCSAGIMENQSRRIENNFTGSFSTETLVAHILAETNNCIMDYLKAYHHWLTENYNLLPKNL